MVHNILNPSKTDLVMLFDALGFAAVRHQHQRRKGSGNTPYVNHPIQVAGLLAMEGGETDPEILVAALLHDVVEDTADGFDQKDKLRSLIEEKYGSRVRSLVDEMTDDKSLDKEERKRLQVEHAPLLTHDARKIKIADKIANIIDITNDPPADWPLERIQRYIEWSVQVVDQIRGTHEDLEIFFDRLVMEAVAKHT